MSTQNGNYLAVIKVVGVGGGGTNAVNRMWELEQILAEVAGLPAVTLQPAAGSQGELTGLMLMRAAFADRGEPGRNVIITADTAHGTNPASVTMAGFELEKVATTDRGNLDLEDLRAKVDDRTAGLMSTASTGWPSCVRNSVFTVPSRDRCSVCGASVENGTSASSASRSACGTFVMAS